MQITSTKMRSASLIGSLVIGSLVLAGCGEVTPPTPTLAPVATATPAMIQETPKAMMDDGAMMDMSKMTGVAMLGGKMMDIWEGGEMMMMEKDLMVGDTKVMMDGKVMMQNGSMKMMKDGEVMMKDGSMKMMDEAMMMEAKEAMTAGKMMDGKDKMMDDGMKKDTMVKNPGAFIPYDTAKLAMAKTGKVVLFFDASWCPSCKTLKKDLNANLSNIPSNLTILDVDYDSSSALKAKYGVTSQHTFVVVDENGAKLKMFSGSNTLTELVSKL